VAICVQRLRQLGQQGLLIVQDQEGRRPLHLAGKNTRGHSSDHVPPGTGQLLGQPEHERRLAAATDDGDDILGLYS